jgi:uncharacterized surface protein with fasciclin (FAS1) repeats
MTMVKIKMQSGSARGIVAGLAAMAVISAGTLTFAGSCGSKSHDIVETATEAGSFRTLVAAVEAAGLVDALKGDGPFTVFAPSDEAFAKLPQGTVESLLLPENKQKLQAILTYHVIPGKVLSRDVKPGQLATLEGSKIRVSVNQGAVMVDQARVVTTDLSASNGVIHVIDSVIMPQ